MTQDCYFTSARSVTESLMQMRVVSLSGLARLVSGIVATTDWLGGAPGIAHVGPHFALVAARYCDVSYVPLLFSAL